MKLRQLKILLLGLTVSCSQTAEKKTESAGGDTNTSDKTANTELVKPGPTKDTLTITGPEFTIDPFDFGENPMKLLTSIEGSSMNYQTYINRHAEDQIDTSFQVVIDVDTFEIYKTASENWVVAAYMNSDRFPTKQGIRIGMTKSEVKEQLKSTNSFPDLVRLEYSGVPEWIDLKFKNDKLDKIEFEGYRD